MLKRIQGFYRFLSRDFLTLKKVSKFIGLYLLVLGVAAGLLSPGVAAYASSQTLKQLSTAQFNPVETLTLTGVQFPLKEFSFSQAFSRFHPGVDLDAEEKTPVYPIAEGKVVEVNRWFWGYGKHVILDHGNGFQSLYAHLSTIEVEVGEKINKDALLGGVGSTGWTTGSHLHLEVWQNGKVLNPLEILSEKEK